MTPEPASPNTDRQVSTLDAEKLEEQLDHLEQSLEDLRHQVQRLQRLASVGTIATMLAHEFNNLLTPILSYSKFAQSSGDPDLLKTALDKCHKNAQRMATMCSKVLGIAVTDQLGPAMTRIRPLLVDAVACLGRDLSKDNIQLTIDAAEDLKVRIHAGSLQQVLFNLVLNARQAMLDRPGRLTLSAAKIESGLLQITVSDTGRGIRPENLDRIFEPFFSTKEYESQQDRRGLGLGLHICKQLMEEQQGDIKVQSTPGQGTTFTLTLPADQA
jgi:signal transduction histidine kinase